MEKKTKITVEEIVMKIKKDLQEIAFWEEPQPGAGEGLGALAGVGMYHQYKVDRDKHEKQVAKVLENIEKWGR